MTPVLLIAWREYRQYVFSRGFILFLVMLPLLMLVGGAALKVAESVRPVRTFIVYDESGQFAPLIDAELERQARRALIGQWDAYAMLAIDRARAKPDDLPAPFAPAPVTNERLSAFADAGGADGARAAIRPYLRPGAPDFSEPKDRFRRLAAPDDVAAAGSADGAARAAAPYLLGEKPTPGAGAEPLFAAVIIPNGFAVKDPGAADAVEAQFWSRNLTDPTLQSAVSAALRSVLRRREAAGLGLSDIDLERLFDVEAPLSAYRPEQDNEGAALDAGDRLEGVVLPGVMTYALLVIVFAVGNPLLTNTIEERTNKIVEVLLSSVTAEQLMAGKLIGIAAVGLTMPAIVLALSIAAALLGVAGGDAAQEALAALFGSNLLPAFVFYFLSAYVIYAMMFLAIGALSNSLQDAQTFMGPLMLLVFAPTPFILMVFQNPNGIVAKVLTWIPIYTPFAAMLRIAADPPLWEIAGASVLMLAFAAVLARYLGRVFKNAILNASPPKASEIWRLARKA